MFCPRCNSPAQSNDMSGGEYSLTCSVCGYYSARIIDTFVDNYPIYRYVEQKPLGTVITKTVNFQYYTLYQRSKIAIENKGCIGYTENRNGVWMFYSFETSSYTPISEMENVYF